MRRAVAIQLSKDERAALIRWARSRTASRALVARAQMFLLAGRGWENQAIAEQLGVHRVTVAKWRQRFATPRLAGIERDRPGRGRPAHKRKHWARTIVEVTLHATPKDATHWSVRSLARRPGVSKSMVERVWRAHEPAPHRVRTFKLSRDPRFIEKLIDVVGLYLRPPEHALVLSVDEKSQIQALDRTQPSLPLKKGRCGTMTHDYKRNGTTTLFAALSLLEGLLIGTGMSRHRHQELLKFLRLIEQQTPAELDLHLILDNYSTHKHPAVQRWLKRHPRFHLHFIPTSSSWLNLVERWFREITTQRIRRGVFRSVKELIAAIDNYIAQHNRNPKSFTWTAKAEAILEKVRRARAVFDKMQTA